MTPSIRRGCALAAEVCAVVLLSGTMTVRLVAQGRPLEGSPRVIRTMVHHQVTDVDRGLWLFRPVVSDSGNRIVFGLNPAADGQPGRLASVDFEGGAVSVLESEAGLRPEPDITADGSRVVYIVANEIRSISADGTGRRALFKPSSGDIDCVKVSGDGRVIVFLVSRGMQVQAGDKYQDLVRGVYAIASDGSDFRRVAGPDEVATVRGISPAEAGNPNFTLEYRPGSIDVSTDGGRIVFGCWAKGSNVVFGCDGRGGGLHAVAEKTPVPGGAPEQFLSIALSGDGTTVAYESVYPSELGVAGFDGNAVRPLLKAGPEDRRQGWPSSAPVFITLDGARVTFEGRQFNADGSGSFQLMYTHQEGVLRYWEYEQVSPDGAGRRFAYFPYEPRPAQLATMELNVPRDRLRGAPRVSDLLVDPPVIPRRSATITIVPSLLAARVASEPAPPKVSSSGFSKGIVDEQMAQFGRVGQTDLFDDGKSAESGDGNAGDGVFSRRWLEVYPEAPDGPRTVRVEAQVKGPDQRLHATVVEIGPYPVVPGSDQPPPPAGATPPIEGTPPAPPGVNPRPGTGGTGTTTGPAGPGTVTGGPGGPLPPGGAIDLTGYWLAETGALHYLRQIGKSVYWSVDALPRARNIYFGTIDGDVVTGTWVDLPGGEIETGTGTLKLKIESNDKLTKISESSPYAAFVWTRTGKPGGPGGGPGGGAGGTGGTGPGTLPGGPAIPPPGVAPEPWQTPAGRQLIDQWAAEAMAKINAYQGSAEFNLRKPFSINKYGLLEGKGLTSAFAPDGFKERGNDRYWFMWDYWIPAPSGWRYPEWNAAGVPALRDYVAKGLAGK